MKAFLTGRFMRALFLLGAAAFVLLCCFCFTSCSWVETNHDGVVTLQMDSGGLALLLAIKCLFWLFIAAAGGALAYGLYCVTRFAYECMRIIFTLCSALCLLLLPSCAFDQYEAGSSTGNYVKETYASLGGTGSIKRSDGSSLVHDHQASFKDAAQTIGIIDGQVIAGSVSKAKNAGDATTAQQLNTQNFNLATQKEADAAAAQAAADQLKKADTFIKAGIPHPKG